LFTFFDAELMLFAIRFMRAAQLPDDLEMLLDEQRLGVSAAYSDTAVVCFCYVNKFICRFSHQHFALASPAPTAS